MVTGKPHKPTKFVRFVLYPLAAILFLMALTAVLVTANGYRISYGNGKLNLTKTGMLIVATRPFDGQIYINGKQTKYKTGFYLLATRIAGLLPGNYDIEVRKDGYRNWKDNLEIKPNMVTWANYILLFAEKLNINKISVPSGKVISVSENGRHILFADTAVKFSLKSLDSNNLSVKDFWPQSVDKPWLVSPKIVDAKYSNSSDRVLLKITNAERTEYVVSDASSEPVRLIHLNSTMGQDFTNVWWNVADNNELFLETKKGISVVKLTATQIADPMLESAVAFKIDESKQIFYISKDSANVHSVSRMNLNGDNKTKLVDNVLPASSYKLGYSAKNEVLTVLNNDTGDLTGYYVGKSSKNHSVNLSKGVTSFAWSKNGEYLLYFGKDFIKRYDWAKSQETDVLVSDTPKSVQWYFDEAHYLVTNSKGVFVMDFDGSNIVLISDTAADTCVLDLGNSNILYTTKDADNKSVFYRFISEF